jgi:hypothetical protein
MKLSLFIGLIAFAACATFGSAQVVNDECAGAVPITLGNNPAPAASGNFYSNVGATTSAGYPATCATMNSDVWFSFTPATTGVYQFSTDTPAGFTSGTETDTVVAVYGSCTAGAACAVLGCDDDGGAIGLLSQVSVGMAAGQTYYVRVGDYSTSVNTGTFYLTVNPNSTMFDQIYSSPAPGCLQVDLVNGTPGGTYFFAATLNQGLFPNGWFYGIDIGIQELVNEVNQGAPFVGTLDGLGHIQIGPVCGLPSGFTVYSVGLGFAGGLGVPSYRTAARCFAMP